MGRHRALPAVTVRDRSTSICVVNGIIKGGEVVGASVLALGRHRAARKGTPLHRTVRNFAGGRGIPALPTGTLLDANPALVSMLGYEEKGDLARG